MAIDCERVHRSNSPKVRNLGDFEVFCHDTRALDYRASEHTSHSSHSPHPRGDECNSTLLPMRNSSQSPPGSIHAVPYSSNRVPIRSLNPSESQSVSQSVKPSLHPLILGSMKRVNPSFHSVGFLPDLFLANLRSLSNTFIPSISSNQIEPSLNSPIPVSINQTKI